MRYLYRIQQELNEPLIYFGLQKSGRIKDHFTLIEERAEKQGMAIIPNSFFLVDDDYRFRYIQRRPSSNKYFGQDVLYGQDFAFYSKDKKKYVISVLYPTEKKNDESYKKIFDAKFYPTLPTIFHLLNELQTDIYEDC